jgi:hypothetical protein
MLFGAVGNFISFSIFVDGAMLLFKKFDIGPFEIGNYLSIGIIFSRTQFALFKYTRKIYGPVI